MDNEKNIDLRLSSNNVEGEIVNKSVLEEMQMKAVKNGFGLDMFFGYRLIETESGADLYFESLNDVNNYIDACDLSEHELRKHYGFPTDSEIAE